MSKVDDLADDRDVRQTVRYRGKGYREKVLRLHRQRILKGKEDRRSANAIVGCARFAETYLAGS